MKALLCHGRGLLIEHDDPNKTFGLGGYVVTNLGQQSIRLGKFIPNEDYLTSIGEKIQKSAFKVSLIDYIDVGGGMVRIANATEIPNAQQGGADQLATAPESKPEGDENAIPESDARPQ